MNSPAGSYQSPLDPCPPDSAVKTRRWGRLYGSSYGLTVSRLVEQQHGLIIVVTEDTPTAFRIEQELKFYLGKDSGTRVRSFPDWETLPYDMFSPHQDIISQRLETLYHLPDLDTGILIAPVATIMHRLVPVDYIQSHCLIMAVGDSVDTSKLRQRFESTGYTFVHQVMEHGEYAIRGSLLDIFPMGSPKPYRIDLFGDDIESIRIFDPETQRTINMVDKIHLLPAREIPLTDEGIQRFRQNYRQKFEGNPQNSPLYRDVSNRLAPNGIEYYLPIFHTQMATLFDYLPENCLMVNIGDVESAADDFWQEVNQRYEELRHDIERPILTPDEIVIPPKDTLGRIRQYPGINLQRFEITGDDSAINFASSATPRLNLNLNARKTRPSDSLKQFVDGFDGRILLVAETTGRREMLLQMLRDARLDVIIMENWPDFVASETKLAIVVAPLDEGLLLESPSLVVLAESQLFGEQVMQRRRRHANRDSETIIRNLTELELRSPVVHEEHGVGRYLGLKRLDVGKIATEFLTLEYAGGDKLYVPVSSLHLISRYTGVSPESAPLHKLGTDRWRKARRKASEKAHDVAVELLDIYARREARKGISIAPPDDQYAAFAAAFPFEETPDQEQAIIDTISDMQSDKPMDRLICGDVGFGKTEVAMRAAFLATHNNRQVAVLVPTTLLAQQHHQNFKDRFADWPVRVEVLSRFIGKKKQLEIIKEIEAGKIDIIIGTHKLLQNDIHFKELGLVILDEEHRFGVRQKERLKSLRSEVDILTLTATPIPRTLNMSLSQIRDMSIIATAPANRIAIKTFVREWNDSLIHEACLREVKRGGQVYFLHNEVKTIDAMADKLDKLIPEATVRFAHGQMSERELEQVMLDFYHQRFNVLVCSTIIETGIDVPSANTIIINRADKFGLAQLYQLRGRVGRSHHRAYAYLVVPPRKTISADAIKRLEAIESLEALGSGFMLATHDLEIRGAGELLGDEQSGQMQEIGFTLYTELLERAVTALKDGKQLDLDRPLDHGAEVDMHIISLIPDDYMPDVHNRLIMYKRIASATDEGDLHELQVEMIDRFGLLPDAVKMLFRVTELKLRALPMGIQKIDIGENGGRLIFTKEPRVDTARIIELIQSKPKHYKLDGNDKLRFTMDMPEIEDRFKHIDFLLQELAIRPAA